MQRLTELPGIRWAVRHPRLAAWIVLSVGMIAVLVVEARDVGLLPSQWVAMGIATVLVAGLSVWIVSWEDVADDSGSESEDAAAGREERF